jgi:hypothetical protein
MRGRRDGYQAKSALVHYPQDNKPGRSDHAPSIVRRDVLHGDVVVDVAADNGQLMDAAGDHDGAMSREQIWGRQVGKGDGAGAAAAKT